MEFKVMGVTDAILTCECCGKDNLKKTVILQCDCQIMHYRTVCAARVLGVSKKEIILKLSEINTQAKKDAK